jgi:hypothetical protein
MTATSCFRATEFAGLQPAKGTYDIAANVLLLGGTIVTIDGDGRADEVTAGQNAAGIAVADFDNRTTAPEGGGAGAVKADVQFGVHGLAYTGTAPEPGQVVYVVDNQTVSTDSDTGSRGIAGYCTELRHGRCYVLMGPAIVGQIVIASTEASQLDTAQVDIDDLQTDMAMERIFVPVTAFAKVAGAPLVVFADGSADGLVVSEGLMYRWNVGSTTAIWTTIPLPDYLDGGEDVIVKLLVSREGSADTTAAVTVGAYFVSSGDAYTADTNCGGDTGAIDQATTLISEESRTLAAADVPSAPLALSLSLLPTAALDADDLNLHGVVIEFARSLTAS